MQAFSIITILVLSVAFIAWLIITDNKQRKAQERHDDMRKTYCIGNVIKYYDGEDPFRSNAFYARIIELRDGWILFELQEYKQEPDPSKGSDQLVKTTIETRPQGSFYEFLRTNGATVIKDCNPK